MGSSINGSKQVLRFIEVLQKLDVHSIYVPIEPTVKFCNKYGRKYVVLVGSNPSSKSPDCSAFHPATKSRQFVDKWFEGKEKDYCIAYANIVDYKTEGNKPLKLSDVNHDDTASKFEAWTRYQNHAIVACGKMAGKCLTKAGVEHFEMPHPSGLCRFWNDKQAGEAKVKEMLEWVEKA